MECGRLEYMQCDVTSQAATWAMADAVVQHEGRLDICMANAGVLHLAKCLEYSGEDFKKVHDVNVAGVLYTAQAAGRQMVKLGTQGSIVLTASMAGSITVPVQDSVAYSTSKSAILQMARSMACELASSGIRVNSISPGYIISQDDTRWAAPRSAAWRAESARVVSAALTSSVELRCGWRLMHRASVLGAILRWTAGSVRG
ncbi:hypothetical protein C8F01DRAFT_1145033, partial [Mycena amicta]